MTAGCYANAFGKHVSVLIAFPLSVLSQHQQSLLHLERFADVVGRPKTTKHNIRIQHSLDGSSTSGAMYTVYIFYASIIYQITGVDLFFPHTHTKLHTFTFSLANRTQFLFWLFLFLFLLHRFVFFNVQSDENAWPKLRNSV